MYNTDIVVRFTMDGVHRWADCDISEVDFLRHEHHHTFHFECTKRVSHDDRDIELIVFKRTIQNWLKTQCFDDSSQCLNFDQMSCEMIAKKLAFEFDLEKCSVYEDGVVGSEVSKQDLFLDGYDIIVVCGDTASGKHHFIENQIKSRLSNVDVISISTIVRSISGKKDRDKLSETASLVDQIKSKMLSLIDDSLTRDQKVVIDGIRQVELIKALYETDEKQLLTLLRRIKFIYLDVPFKERVSRYMKREGFASNNEDMARDALSDLDRKHSENYKFHQVRSFIDTYQGDSMSPHSFEIIKYH